ncbi:hypothetical protein DM01DRAFT_1208186 [Hesseltinella vesiculosa]|uniref:Uncharacterized protein n=1 Tax=Hesseltinella vesiculosa TaxID=101127 RepID=A0A1X2GRE1_9FUNG|nr:hypothetical protein DM01DRAFT_1208186 [Hesseltinella vesiculosa]
MDFLGRQMDVNAASSGVAISTNVWTSDDTPEAFLAEQHCRSYHASKSLLKSIQRLPFDRDVAKTLGCIAMDWTGSVGYSYAMFLLEDDVYFTLPCADLFIPTYVSDLPEFFTTLDALFVWKNDQIDMMNIVMPMVLKQKRQSKLDLLRRRTCSVLDDDGA